MIEARRLTRRFGRRTVVEDVTLAIGRGEIVALLGPNGAGKTTTLRMLAGLIPATSGTVLVDGSELTAGTAGAFRQRIGFLTETPGLWDRLTVLENLSTYAALYDLADGRTRIARLLDTFGLLTRADTVAAELSKGMRQKVAIARALLHDPDILLLDEPTSGLDPEVTRSVRHLLGDRRAKGCAILLSTHNLDEAERQADRIAVLQRGLLAVDTPQALRGRMSTGRILIRTRGDASRWLASVSRVAADAEADGSFLTLTLPDLDGQTPVLVSKLVGEGAEILEVRRELPALEDVYLHLVGDRA